MDFIKLVKYYGRIDQIPSPGLDLAKRSGSGSLRYWSMHS